MEKLRAYGFSLFLLSMLLSTSSTAATYINYTRLIINEKEREVSFTIYNEGSRPALMQLWIDKDNILEQPEKIKVPFVILPPVFRLDRKSSRAVRLQFTGDWHSLPADRESLFWLNTLEVPPVVADKEASGALQVAFRTRVKLFWRPAALTKISHEESIKKLRISPEVCGVTRCLALKNNSPLHLTLTDITLRDGHQIKQLPADGLIAPFSSIIVPLPGSTKKNDAVTAFSWIDDYGMINTYMSIPIE